LRPPPEKRQRHLLGLVRVGHGRETAVGADGLVEVPAPEWRKSIAVPPVLDKPPDGVSLPLALYSALISGGSSRVV